MKHDIIIVGAGSAGCPLAARLSEHKHLKVLLLEAGPHYKSFSDYPRELQKARSTVSSTPGHPNNWSFMGNVSAKVSYPIPRGKVVGGSSALNGTVFNRGIPEDFDGWAAQGNEQWSFHKVLPYFRKLETDQDFQDQFHGSHGPIPVRRPKESEWATDQHAFVAACVKAGYAKDPDKNSPTSEGVGPLPMNNVDGMRMNTAITYLHPNLDRPNLTIWGNVFVRRILFDKKRAIGVEAEKNGETIALYGEEIVLSAGAIKSPHLLMLSGIGPAAELKRAGVSVVHDSPAVGKNFMDHPSVVIHYRTKRRIPDDPSLPQVQTSLHYTASGSPSRCDMEILPFCVNTFGSVLDDDDVEKKGIYSYLPSFMRRPFKTLAALRGISIKRLLEQYRHRNDRMICCVLQQPAGRGNMVLKSADPHEAPELNYNYFSHKEDLRRMRESVRLAVKLIHGEDFARLGAQVTTPLADQIASDEMLDDWILNNVMTAVHMAASCKMGPASDPEAVVDQYCRVRGVERLRVVDPSIQPTAVRRAANATAVMIGERSADLILSTLASNAYASE